MSVSGDGVQVEGTTLKIDAGDDATARIMADAAVQAKTMTAGTKTQKAAFRLDKFFDGVSDFNNVSARNTAHILSWALLVIGAAFAYESGKNLWHFDKPIKVLGVVDLIVMFGWFAIVIVTGAKFSAGRWAKAKNKGDIEAAKMFRNVTMVCLFVSAALGFALQTSNELNRESGAQANRDQIEANEGTLRNMRMQADEMDRPRETAAQIERDIAAMKARPAVNYDGKEASFNIAKAVDDGKEAYCRGSSYYKNKYCPDLLDLEGALEARKAYEAKLEAIAALEVSTSQIRDKHMELSSAEAMSQMFKGTGEGAMWRGALFGMILIFAIDFLMVGASYVAHRYPKGV